MKHLHHLVAALLSSSELIGHAQAEPISVPYNSLLTRGQGYNTFLGKGAKRDAVLFNAKSNRKRALPTRDGNEFNFTAPGLDILGNKNAQAYFKPATPTEINNRLDKIGREFANATDSGKDNTKRPRTNARVINLRDIRSDCSGHVKVNHELLTSYEKYLKALDISASATISGWGQSATISGRYLDKSEFSTNSLIYLATLEVTKQKKYEEKTSFNKAFYSKESFLTDYGDRYIQGFETGGKMMARLVITSKGKSSSKDIEANAEASLKFWGVSADISASVKQSMSELSKQADVKVTLFYQGELGKFQEQSGKAGAVATSAAQDAFTQVKSWADTFLNNACNHEYNYKALLDEYSTVPDFPRQKIPNYRTSNEVAFAVLEDVTKMSEMYQLLLSNKDLNDKRRQELKFDYLDRIEACQDWTEEVAGNPAKVIDMAKQLMMGNAEFNKKYMEDIPKKMDETWICGWGDSGRNGNKCTSDRCCSSVGWCGTTPDHCGTFMWGGPCQSDFGRCYPKGAKEGEGCGFKNGNKVCSPGLCCSNDGKCNKTKTTEKDPNYNFGQC